MSAGEQVKVAVMAIPSILASSINHWPAAISFAGVGYVENLILSAIPNPGGMAGMFLAAWARGWVQVVNFATWEEMKGTRYDVIPDPRGFMRSNTTNP